MLVTLAYPIDGLGQPDETVEVDDARGRTLLRDGFARRADSAKPAEESAPKSRAKTRSNPNEEDTADGR